MTDIGSTFGGPAPHDFTTYNPVAAVSFPIGTPVTGSFPPSTPGEVIPANATLGTGNRNYVIGLATTPGIAGQRVNVKYIGPVELRTEQWDQITGQVGGLTPGQQYYLSSGLTGTGKMQTTPANELDDSAAESVIGRALTSTSFFIQPSSRI